jgi:hypothetical protein
VSTHDPDSVPCECGHMRGIHKTSAPNPCVTAGCGCKGFRVRKPGPAAPADPPRVIQGRVERELPPAAPERVTLTRIELAICPACDVDRCDTCFRDGCACACNEAPLTSPDQPQPRLRETMTTITGSGDPLRNFAVHLAARMRALGWDQAVLQEKAGISAHVAAKAINGTGADLGLAGKIAELVGGQLAVMIGPYTCSTCDGTPPKGYRCLECGAEARAA